MAGASAVVDTTGAPLPDTLISSPAPTHDPLQAVDLKRHLERVLEEQRAANASETIDPSF